MENTLEKSGHQKIMAVSEVGGSYMENTLGKLGHQKIMAVSEVGGL